MFHPADDVPDRPVDLLQGLGSVSSFQRMRKSLQVHGPLVVITSVCPVGTHGHITVCAREKRQRDRGQTDRQREEVEEQKGTQVHRPLFSLPL